MRLQAATDDTSIKIGENDLALARLETTKNDVLPRIDAEKNTLALQAAEARLPSLRTSVALKRKAADAELEILAREARPGRPRPRSRPGHRRRAPRPRRRSTAWWCRARRGRGRHHGRHRGRRRSVARLRHARHRRPGPMRVKVKVNQVDLHRLQVGMPARVTLDAYPAKSYPARLVQIAPIATSRFLSRRRCGRSRPSSTSKPKPPSSPPICRQPSISPSAEGARAAR